MKSYVEKFLVNRTQRDGDSERLRIHSFLDSTWEPGVVSKNHGGQYAMYSMVLQGCYSITEASGERSVFSAGEIRIVNSSEKYRKAVSLGRENLIRKCVLVEMNRLHNEILSCMFGGNFLTIKLSEPEKVEKIMDSIRENLSDPEKTSDVILSGLLMMLLHELSRQANRRKYPEKLLLALDFMERNLPDGTLSLEDAAHHAGTGVRTLSRLFHDHLEVSPGQYLRERRLERAVAMISASDLCIKETAALCGFGSASFLAKTFREKFGRTPKQFRKGTPVIG